ncbi:hypothetical protein CN925_18480 [Bacillus sp. AFS055030]|nr:hypothetical protein CN925_18480 [Bacillus sp. AFS055030]
MESEQPVVEITETQLTYQDLIDKFFFQQREEDPLMDPLFMFQRVLWSTSTIENPILEINI